MLKHEIISHVGELPVFINYYTRSNDLIPSHWHKHMEIILITEGTMTMDAGASSTLLLPGDIYIINSETIHQTRISNTTTVLLLQIPYDLLEQSIHGMAHTTFQEHLAAKTHGDDPHFREMTHCLMEMRRIYGNKEKGYAFLFNSALHRFLFLLYSHYSYDEDPSALPLSSRSRVHLKKAIDYIDSNYKEAISLEEIASHLALNPEYFCRMFKKNMGVTFLNYLNQVRLVHIYKDLQRSQEPISVIQAKHGFSNYKVFSRMFKESYGCTPSEVRDLKG